MPGAHIDIHWLGINEFEAALLAKSVKTSAETRLAIGESAAAVEGAAKRKAPVISGSLRRSIMTDPVVPFGLEGWMTSVYPSVAYGRRIELGFFGTDRLGRTYNQTGHPYLEPGLAESVPEIGTIFLRHWAAAIEG